MIRERSKAKVSDITAFTIICFVTVTLCWSLTGAQEYPWLGERASSAQLAAYIENSIPTPEGYTRVKTAPGSIAEWLRKLPVKPAGSAVLLFPVAEKRLKSRQDVHERVIDLDVMQYQQCADAIIRLWAEYLWSVGRFDHICFNFTSGDACCWLKWAEGWRPKISTNKVFWTKSQPPRSDRPEFRRYLELVMTYAGTTSLARDLAVLSPDELAIGDIIVEPGVAGAPGHAVIIVDMVSDSAGKKLMLLAQSYMPSQELHVLKNHGSPMSPWYELPFGNHLKTPEWQTFRPDHCRRLTLIHEGHRVNKD